MTDEDTKILFSTNEDFHEYVLRFCRKSGDTIEQALRKSIIKEVGKAYADGGVNERR